MTDKRDDGPDFAPYDPTDGREEGDWKSRYPAEAQKKILLESAYLGVCLFGSVALIVIAWLAGQHFVVPPYYQTHVITYGFAWLGGVLGGTAFDMKWLYHTVARNIWNLDRRLWRVFVPHLSGCLAFAVVVLMSCGLIQVFDQEALRQPSLCLAVGFLTGYFSDSAAAKLRDISNTIFGPTRRGKDKATNGSNKPI